MIYTVTLNPSLDYVVDVDDFELGRTNRAVSERLYAGGKGINVSFVLKNLGFESTALGFSAGFTGEEEKEADSGKGNHRESYHCFKWDSPGSILNFVDSRRQK